MQIKKTKLSDILVIRPKVFHDERGFFSESYSMDTFLENELEYNFIQDNQSYNKFKNTFRGLHYQMNPKAQTTLVRVVTGSILDIVVDLRKKSSTFGQYTTEVLSAENFKQMLIPKGFAHGFLTLTDDVNLLYKMDVPYSATHDRILNVRDNTINIELGIDFNQLIIADKDNTAPMLNDIENNF